MKVFKSMLVVCIVFFVSGCISMGSQKLLLNQDVSFEQYDKIKHIVIEEAASNGYSKLMSEVKPSEYNNWKGELYFKTETIYGTDQLTVEFNKVGEGISVYIHGAGIRGNAESATKAILGRLDKEGLYKAAESETSDKKSQPTTVRPSPPPTTTKLKATTSEKSDSIYLITIKNSNIRAAPNTKSQIITTVKKGTRIEKIGESRDWFKVRLPSGKIGHIYKPLAATEAPPAATEAPPAATEAPPATNEASLKTPTKDILVTSGDFTRPYDILGEVECTLTGKDVTVAVASGPPQDTKDIKDLLRKVAFTKYGERVDAIINTKTVGGVQGGVWALMGAQFGAKTGTVTANGIAVHFK